MARLDPTKRNEEGNPLQFRPLYPRDVDLPSQWGSDRIAILNPSSEGLGSNGRYLIHHPLSLWWQRLETFAVPNRPRWPGFVALQGDEPCGMVEVSPFNRTRSTWQVDRVFVEASASSGVEGPLFNVGSQLLRHCFEAVWEARMWLAEVDIEHKSSLALYRQNGFQPLAQVTYWEIDP